MKSTDEIFICCESSEQLEKSLERREWALETRGIKVCIRITENLSVSIKLKLQGVNTLKVDEFKHPELTVQSNCQNTREVKKRVQAGWSGKRQVSWLICDRRAVRVKGRVVKPAFV